MLTPEQIADVARYGQHSPHAGKLVAWWRSHLAATIPPGERWTWPHVLETLGIPKGKAGEAQRVPLVRALRRLRDRGWLKGMWEPCPERRYRGSPVILWRNPDKPDCESV